MKLIFQLLKSNEDGYVLVITLFLLLLLTVIGMAATHTSNVEIQISGNNKKLVQDFYLSEGGLITVLENSGWWLGDDFLKGNAAAAHWTGNVDVDGDGAEDAFVEIRCIEPRKSNIAALGRAANSIPADRHSGPPPADSGYSARHFKIRKYAVTATGLQSGINLQAGVWKVFSKY